MFREASGVDDVNRDSIPNASILKGLNRVGPGSARMDPKNLGKGDCYKANYHLFKEMDDLGLNVKLCHGILTAPSWYQHMEEGTRFMHCWVECDRDLQFTVHDASLGEYSWHTREMFYEQMKPGAVYRMRRTEAEYHGARTGNYGGWGLLPQHREVL